MLCPVIACSENGCVLVVRSAVPLTKFERDQLWECDQFPDWYEPGTFDTSPCEWKSSDWGHLEGRLVALDYSTPAHCTAPEFIELLKRLHGA
jgi:hypothetical protein